MNIVKKLEQCEQEIKQHKDGKSQRKKKTMLSTGCSTFHRLPLGFSSFPAYKILQVLPQKNF